MSQFRAAIAEEFVARYLIDRGYRIVARNVRHIGFELDIVAWRRSVLAIVEVKLRRRPTATLWAWEEMLSARKKTTLVRGAKWIETEYGHWRASVIRIDLAIVIYDSLADQLQLDYRESLDLSD